MGERGLHFHNNQRDKVSLDTHDQPAQQPKNLGLDVELLRENLGPKKVRLIDRWIREVNGPLNTLIQNHMPANATVVDLGCSRGDPDIPALQKADLFIGCDIDVSGLIANNQTSCLVMAPMEQLPFPNNSIDLLVSKWVFEHINTPDEVFAECFRVLKPGGKLIILTPNSHSIFVLCSRAIPFKLKSKIKKSIFRIHEEDTFKTSYLANSKKRLFQLADNTGFKNLDWFLLPGMWTFFVFSTTLSLLVRKLEHLLCKVPVLCNMTAYILAAWEKPRA